jgi:hypothetical protein
MMIGGFSKELGNAIQETNGKCDRAEMRALLTRYRIIPDAYLIDRSAKVVYLFEIEDSNPLTADKLRKISEIWFRLDSIGWDMRIFLVDRYSVGPAKLPSCCPETTFG